MKEQIEAVQRMQDYIESHLFGALILRIFPTYRSFHHGIHTSYLSGTLVFPRQTIFANIV